MLLAQSSRGSFKNLEVLIPNAEIESKRNSYEAYPQLGDHGYDYWMATQNNAEPSHKNPSNFVRNGKPVGELKGFSAPLEAAEATRWLSENRDQSKPFVLSIWVHEPHSPIATDPQFSDLYDGHENSKYMGNITQLDHALGTCPRGCSQGDAVIEPSKQPHTVEPVALVVNFASCAVDGSWCAAHVDVGFHFKVS